MIIQKFGTICSCRCIFVFLSRITYITSFKWNCWVRWHNKVLLYNILSLAKHVSLVRVGKYVKSVNSERKQSVRYMKWKNFFLHKNCEFIFATSIHVIWVQYLVRTAYNILKYILLINIPEFSIYFFSRLMITIHIFFYL